MRKFTFKAPASVWDYRSGDPDLPVKDPTVLKNYDGYVYEDECFDEYMSGINDRELEEAGVSGGYLKFEYQNKNNMLFGFTEYNLRRKLTDPEVLKLREYTLGQWSDGNGSNLMQNGMNSDGISLQMECFIEDLITTEQVIT